ncbi:MAG TPA: TylF/MycF/NovP-related O-methyltransferase [Terracidiphilus sp.]|jgi:hypothetical protein
MAHTASRGNLQRFLEMNPRKKLNSIRWWITYLRLSIIAKAAFGVVSWHPRGKLPLYMAYYPESLRADRSVDKLFAKWIRGNRVNNNGDATRFVSFLLNIRKTMEDGIPGDMAELGVWRGNSAAMLAKAAEQHSRTLFLFDTFEGFDGRDLKDVDSKSRRGQFGNTSIDYVKETVGCEAHVRYIKGFFPESIPNDLENSRFSIVHIDCDLYGPMKAALEFFYPRMSKGALLIMHDYHSGTWPGATNAVNEFCAATGETLILLPDKSGTAVCRKTV